MSQLTHLFNESISNHKRMSSVDINQYALQLHSQKNVSLSLSLSLFLLITFPKYIQW